jgi:RNA-dependent RNA polymerase
VNPSKEYPEINIISANSIGFGTKDADLSMLVMYKAESHGNIRVMLNLDRKEVDIQFPMALGVTIRKYRFRLPIALLPRIFRVDCNRPGQINLIIPFESAPQFFVQRMDGDVLSDGRTHTGFSEEEKTWIDWHTWFRETDVTHDSTNYSLKKVPLMNSKDKAIIDIGKPIFA